jgi:hypothetical protein
VKDITLKELIKRAERIRDTARAEGNLQLSNKIHFLLFLVTKAKDNAPAKPGHPPTAYDRLMQLVN